MGARGATARGERTREQIVAAAMGAFAERGYDAASVADVAARAGIAKSVIYDHFPSKAELHRAIVEGEAAELQRHVDALRANPRPTREERLRAGLDTFFRFVEDRPGAWRLLVRDPPSDPMLVEVHARVHRAAAMALARLVAPEDGAGDGLVAEHVELYAELVRTSICASAGWWYEHPEVPRAQLVELVMGFAWTGLERLVEREGALALA